MSDLPLLIFYVLFIQQPKNKLCFSLFLLQQLTSFEWELRTHIDVMAATFIFSAIQLNSLAIVNYSHIHTLIAKLMALAALISQ